MKKLSIRVGKVSLAHGLLKSVRSQVIENRGSVDLEVNLMRLTETLPKKASLQKLSLKAIASLIESLNYFKSLQELSVVK